MIASPNNSSDLSRCRTAVLIPVFQGQKDLEDTLTSLVSLGTECDIIVVDDGSNPPIRVPEVECPVGVHLIRLEKNQGIVAALNAGLRACLERGYEFIARIDAGDYAKNDRLAKQVGFLDSNPHCVMVGSDSEVCDEDGSHCYTFAPPRDPDKLAAAFHEKSWLLHPSVMFRASVFRETALYSDRYPAAEDYELFLRLACRFEIGLIPEPLLLYVIRKSSISGRKAHLQLRSRMRIQARYFDWTKWQSYYGILRTAGLLIIPEPLKNALKRRLLHRKSSIPLLDPS